MPLASRSTRSILGAQSISATIGRLSTSRFERAPATWGSKEVARSKRATQERIENGYDHGRSPFGPIYDEVGRCSVPTHDIDEHRTALACIRLREDGRSWRESERNYVSKDTARRIYTCRERYLPADSNECSPTPPPNHTAGSSWYEGRRSHEDGTLTIRYTVSRPQPHPSYLRTYVKRVGGLIVERSERGITKVIQGAL